MADSDSAALHYGRALMDDRLASAIDSVLVGGNHLVTHAILRGWPEAETDPLVALERLGAGMEFDAWCAWRAIMLAASVLRSVVDG